MMENLKFECLKLAVSLHTNAPIPGGTTTASSIFHTADTFIEYCKTTVKTNVSIYELTISGRAINCLRADGVEYISDLLKYTRVSLSQVPNLGKKSLIEITEALLEYGDLRLSNN